MNIFVLHHSTVQAARAHCDKHVVKMILESAQLLSTAINVTTGVQQEGLYKTTHINHPCSIWARQTSGNFYWLSELALRLVDEYKYRYGKDHKSIPVITRAATMRYVIPVGPLMPFVFCGPDDLSELHQDPVEAYRAYYQRDKASMLKYTRREVPEWLNV